MAAAFTKRCAFQLLFSLHWNQFNFLLNANHWHPTHTPHTLAPSRSATSVPAAARIGGSKTDDRRPTTKCCVAEKTNTNNQTDPKRLFQNSFVILWQANQYRKGVVVALLAGADFFFTLAFLFCGGWASSFMAKPKANKSSVFAKTISIKKYPFHKSGYTASMNPLVSFKASGAILSILSGRSPSLHLRSRDYWMIILEFLLIGPSYGCFGS